MKFLPYALLFILTVLGAWFYQTLTSQFAPSDSTSVPFENTAQSALVNSVNKVKDKLAVAISNAEMPRATSHNIEHEKASVSKHEDLPSELVSDEKQQVQGDNSRVRSEYDVNTGQLEEPMNASNVVATDSVTNKEKIDDLISAMSREGQNPQWQAHVEQALDHAKEQLPMLRNLQASRVDCRETVCAVNISMSDEDIRQFKTLGLDQQTGLLESDATFHIPEGAGEIVVYLKNI